MQLATRTFTVLAAIATASTLSSAQHYGVSGSNAFGSFYSETGSSPLYGSFVASNGTKVIHSSASSSRLHASASSYGCCTFCDYGSGGSSSRFDDVVFTSATSDPLLVGLRLTLVGSGSFSAASSFGSNVTVGGIPVASGEVKLGGQGGSGYFAGWVDETPLETTAWITVTPNVPTSIGVGLNSTACGNNGSTLVTHALLELGHASSGTPEVVFDLPAGVDVSSAQAGIVAGSQTPFSGIQTHAGPDPLFAPGSLLSVAAWNGVPGNPAAIFVTDVGGTPLVPAPLFGGIGILDESGVHQLPHIPANPNWVGLSFTFLAAALDEDLEVEVGSPVTISVIAP